MHSIMPERTTPAQGVYAPQRNIADVGACDFYHTMELPGHGLVEGQWDLRGGEEAYLGGISLRGKRVLELGTASGFLCRYMESRGADVVGFDLAAGEPWDFVPMSRFDAQASAPWFMDHIERIKNSWWFCHHLFHSRARAVYGTVYRVPREIGLVDVSTFGCILLHLHDPFAALRSALSLTKETVVVTDVCPEDAAGPHVPFVTFAPNFRAADLGQSTTWWSFSPQIIVEFLGVLGFEKTQVTYHTQMKRIGPARLFTVVGTRTQPLAA